MKYFLQLEGRERLLIKCVFVLQVIIIGLVLWNCARPNYLYIDTEQLKEIYSWQKQNSEEHRQKKTAKAEESLD